MTLTGKTAVITGSNSGIGLAIARELAKSGADVVLNSFTDSDGDHALAAQIAEEFGVNARYIRADMSLSDDCRTLIADAGACDILVSNAGIQHVAPVEEFRSRYGTGSLPSTCPRPFTPSLPRCRKCARVLGVG